MQSPRDPVLALPAPPVKAARQHMEAAAQTLAPGPTALSSEASTLQVTMNLVFAQHICHLNARIEVQTSRF